MIVAPLPLAWIEGLGPLLVVAFWIIRSIYQAIGEQKELEEAKNEQARKAERPAGELPPRQVVGKAGGPAAEGDLRSEIDEFLKRVGEEIDPEPVQEIQEARVAPEPPPAPAAPDPPRRRLIDPFEEPRRVRRQPAPAAAAPEPPTELRLEPPRPEPAPGVREPHRELRHLPESQLAEQAAHLGARIAGADDRVEARLHEKFDHKLGKLGSSQKKADETPVSESQTGAQRIKALLARPGGVREAIVLGEILRRPSDQL